MKRISHVVCLWAVARWLEFGGWVIANLELMPVRMNERKNAKIGQRQRSLARKLNGAGLLSDAGFKAVLAVR